MRKKIKMILIVTVISILFSCETKKNYDLDLVVTKSDEKNITVDISTNLPNKSTVLLSVIREFKQEGDTEIYSGDIFEKDIEINNGNFKIIIPIEDITWHSEYQNLLETYHQLGNFKPISQISDSIEVSVIVTPKRQENKDVLRKIGENGENLAVEESDRSKQRGFKTLDKDTVLCIPFKLK